MRFQFVKVCVFRQKFRKMFGAGESVQIDKYRVAFNLAGIFHAHVVRVGKHRHNFLFNNVCFVAEVNAVAQRFAHFGLAVNAGQAQAGFVGRQDDFRLG